MNEYLELTKSERRFEEDLCSIVLYTMCKVETLGPGLGLICF